MCKQAEQNLEQQQEEQKTLLETVMEIDNLIFQSIINLGK